MKMNLESLKTRIYNALTGEGGLLTDFCPDTIDKTLNMEMVQVCTELINNEEFKNKLLDDLAENYIKVCEMRNIDSAKSFEKVYDQHQLCVCARWYGLQIFNNERIVKDVKGRI